MGLCIAKTCAEIVQQMRRKGSTAQFVSLSNTSSASFVKQLGIHARGVMVAQVFPSPRGGATALAREFQALARDHSLPLTYSSIEGFLAAKILVEALRRAGPSASSESLVQALETLRNHDAGGFVVSFGPGQRSGSVFVELSMIDSEGRFMR
jgi:ABC-type branched-subunit amino acid transport system substrate-binding protein